MAKKKPKRVKAQLLKGFRDYDPPDQLAREKMLTTLSSACQRMGFLPLQTASLEFAETLLGPHYTDDNLAELFGFKGPDEIGMALRYEFTVSLARYVASQPQLPMPFRRYQYGNVWRVDKPGPGRFREFMQFDIDIVGAKNLLSDAEIIAAMVTTLDDLGIERFQVRYSNRKILNGLVKWAKIPAEQGPDVMRVIDKLDKQGKQAVLLELGPGRTDQSGDKITGLGLPDEQIHSVEQFLDLAINESTAPLRAAGELLEGMESAIAGIQELEKVQAYLHLMGVPEDKVTIDLTIVRGLGYYTGPVFETVLLDLPEYGSVFSGGRYDNLLDRFQSQSVPATGASIGIDRLQAALIHLEAIDRTRATSKVLVTVMDRENIPIYLQILAELRSNDIPSEMFLGETHNLSRQVRYGDKVGIPFAVIVGSEELQKGQVTVKNLVAGSKKASDTSDREEWLKAEGFQETISRADLIPYLKNRLS